MLVMVEELHVILNLTLLVPKLFTDGVETHGNTGLLVQNVGVVPRTKHSQLSPQIKYSVIYHSLLLEN
jgi:hypothetical protein